MFDNNFAEQVKAAVDIVRVISEYVRLRKPGQLHRLCPFHTEDPSFNVHQAVSSTIVLDVKRGDVSKFVQSMEQLPFRKV
jgi:DNA primase